MAPGSFAFSKWYIDCLDRDGRLVILYWTSLEWKGVRLTWHSASVHTAGAPARTTSSVVATAPPVHTPSSVTWESTRLRCEATLSTGVRAIPPQQLADGVTWSCVAPAARAVVKLGDTTFTGTGYAELIQLRVPPWKLGISGLRWGRWISDDATGSMVWIVWHCRPEGAQRPKDLLSTEDVLRYAQDDRRWLFLNGAAAPATTLETDSMSSGSTTLTLDAPTALVDRSIGATIRRFPALRAVAPKWLVAGHEIRRTRSGILREGSSEIRGTAVDETVEFG